MGPRLIEGRRAESTSMNPAPAMAEAYGCVLLREQDSRTSPKATGCEARESKSSLCLVCLSFSKCCSRCLAGLNKDERQICNSTTPSTTHNPRKSETMRTSAYPTQNP